MAVLIGSAVISFGSPISTSPASAADLSAPLFDAAAPSLAEPKVEFGTGWYIRGDVGWDLDSAPVLSSDLTYVAKRIKNNWDADLGAGYQFNNWFRADATLGWFRKQQVRTAANSVNCPSQIFGVDQYVYDSSGKLTTVKVGEQYDNNQCTPIQQTATQKYLLLGNVYADLGTWAGFTPYIGAGIGGAYLYSNSSIKYYNNTDGSPYRANLVHPSGYPVNPTYQYGPQNWDRATVSKRINFAFALMGGVAFDVTTNMKLDIGYRYVNFGRLTGITTGAGPVFSTTLTTQEVRVGLRYMVD
jgi:opacity protein-like surface antigen